MTRLGLAAALAVTCAARAYALEPIEDHRDQWGLTLELGTVYDIAVNQRSAGSSNYAYNPGFLPSLEVGATWAVTDTGDEVTARLRFVSPVLGGPADPSRVVLDNAGDPLHWLFPSLLAGYRGYFGYEELKTFFDADVFLNSYPYWGVGPDVGLGLQYDVGRGGGVFVRLGFGVTFGATILTSFDGELGGQLRF